MNFRPLIASLLLSLGFVGCATYSDQELGQIRQRGVSPVVFSKLIKGGMLSPSDVIELSHRGVADNLIIRQIEDAGVDYILTRADLKTLEKARVSQAVVNALISASDEFASFYGPYNQWNAHAYPYYGYPYYDYGPYPYPYGGTYLYFGGGGHRHWR